MRTHYPLIAASILVLLAGCASTPSSKLASTPVSDASGDYYDREYMAKVERRARQYGIEVQWVNPPLKRKHD